MAEEPTASLPDRSGSWAELMGAYRLLNNPRVDPAEIQRSHWRWTYQRCSNHPVVLCVQDTSDIDFTGHAAKKGLGPIGRQKGQGFLQHSALAVLPDGRLLGVLHQRWQVRVAAPAGEPASRCDCGGVRVSSGPRGSRRWASRRPARGS